MHSFRGGAPFLHLRQTPPTSGRSLRSFHEVEGGGLEGGEGDWRIFLSRRFPLVLIDLASPSLPADAIDRKLSACEAPLVLFLCVLVLFCVVCCAVRLEIGDFSGLATWTTYWSIWCLTALFAAVEVLVVCGHVLAVCVALVHPRVCVLVRCPRVEDVIGNWLTRSTNRSTKLCLLPPPPPPISIGSETVNHTA